jgi:hypothetical protein
MEDGPISALRRTQEDRAMKYTSWTILAFVGSLIFLVLFIKDWETKMDADKLSRVKLPHHSGLNADPKLMLISAFMALSPRVLFMSTSC